MSSLTQVCRGVRFITWITRKPKSEINMVVCLCLLLNKKKIYGVKGIKKNNNQISLLFLVIHILIDRNIRIFESNQIYVRKMKGKWQRASHIKFSFSFFALQKDKHKTTTHKHTAFVLRVLRSEPPAPVNICVHKESRGSIYCLRK